MLTISEAAERLGLSLAMIRRYCSQGKLPAQKIGRDWVIRQNEVERFAALPRQSGRPALRYAHSMPIAQRISEK
ncbi:MAG: helix-turn-helix domain-containing protein [Chloroflexota bacterium]